MKKNDYKANTISNENSSEESFSLIKFKRKKMKSSIRLGSKLFMFLILAGISGALFAKVTMKLELNKAMAEIKESSENNSSVILNYNNIINVVSPSLVTISDSDEKLMNNSYYDENMTGIIISNDGTIFTNYSKVKDLNEIYVKLASKGTLPLKAEFISGDEQIDIAILKIDYDGELTPIKIANKESVRAGDGIAILSNSIGDEYIGTIIPGIITSTRKNYKSIVNNKEYSLLETNAVINDRNTGGALCNYKGELIGISSQFITNKVGSEGLYYAIDLGELEKIINSSTETKSILGIVDGSIVNNDRDKTDGFYISKVKKGGNAYNAGIKPTDILIEIDGVNIKTSTDMTKGLKNKKNGDTIECKVMRNGEILNISIVLNEV
ncbi:MAG: S1C family serine protease [Clostridium sp.]